jgi:hypothetical protein
VDSGKSGWPGALMVIVIVLAIAAVCIAYRLTSH